MAAAGYKNNDIWKLIDFKTMAYAKPGFKGLFFGILMLCQLAWGCYDPCSGSGSGAGGSKGDIYFTARPINGEIPSVFRISPKGSGLMQLIENGSIYSPPSENGLLAFLRDDPVGNDSIIVAGINGDNPRTVINSLLVGTIISTPIISPNGKLIAFTGGNNELWTVTISGSSADRPTSVLAGNTLPAFSPDGSMLAFFESNTEKNKLILRVIETENIRNEVYRREIDILQDALIAPPSIDWSGDNSSVAFGITTEKSGVIYLDDIIGKTYEEFLLDNLGPINPDLSPTVKNRVSFSSRNGDIWSMKLENGDPDFRLLTERDSTESNLYPQWSANGEMILYNSRFILDNEYNGATLILIRLDEDDKTVSQMVIGNNVIRGYWY